ncbi:MAG: hypothetical protein AAF518_25125 [Spirochaetota bacterium]
MQNKKLYDEIFKEILKEILRKQYHLEVEYEIPGNPKHIDFYLEAKDKPINEAMTYLKIFAKYNLMEFKSEGDIFRDDDILKMYAYIANFLLGNRDKKGQLHFILFCSIKPKLLFQEYQLTQIKQGIYYTQEIRIVPVYVVVISELPNKETGEIERIRLFQQKNKLDSYLEESILKGRDLKYALLLYRKRIERIAKRLGVNMTAIEERARELGWISIEEAQKKEDKVRLEEKEKMQKFAKIREQRRERRNSLQTALRMQQKGCELAFIAEMTEIPVVNLERFFTKLRRI